MCRCSTIILFLLFTVTGSFVLQAQSFYSNNGLRFEHFQISDGLPDNSVRAVLEDQKGFIWLGTLNGLVRYDGYEFKTYKPAPGRPGHLQGRKVSHIFEDSRGYIWVATTEKGLHRFDPKTESFYHFRDLVPEMIRLEGGIYAIAEDASGAICVGTINGLFRILNPGDNGKKFDVRHYLPQKLPRQIYELVDQFNNSGRKLAGLNNIRDRQDLSLHFELTKPTRVLLLSMGIKTPILLPNGMEDQGWLENDKGDTLWTMSPETSYDVGEQNGAVRIQAGNLELPAGRYHIRFNTKSNGAYSCTDQIPDHHWKYYGIQAFRLKTEESQQVDRLLKRYTPASSILEKQINTICKDVKGRTWLGGGGGMTQLIIPDPSRPDSVHFKLFQPLPGRKNDIGTTHIYSIAPAQDGDIWIGGLTHYEDLSWGKTVLKRFDPDAGIFYTCKTSFPSQGAILTMRETKNNELWLAISRLSGNQEGNLFRLHPPLIDEQDNSFRFSDLDQYNFAHNELNLLGDNSIWAIETDQGGGIWLGTSWQGLYKVNPVSNKFHFVKLSSKVKDKQIAPLAFHQDNRNRTWVGTSGEGLFCYDEQYNLIHHFTYDPTDPNSISNDMIVSILADDRGRLWFCTGNGMMNRYDEEDEQFHRHPLYEHSHPFTYKYTDVNSVVDAIKGQQGFFWVLSNFQIYRFNPNQSKTDLHHSVSIWKNYLNEQENLAIYEDKSGELWVLTLNAGIIKLDKQYNTANKLGLLAEQYMPDHSLVDAYEDSRKRFWIGGRSSGLHLFDKKLGMVKRSFTESDGLLHDHVDRIIEDNNGKLWLITPRGLSRFDPNTNTFTNYGESRGIRFFEHLPGKAYQNKKGEIICPGVDGFYVFHPEEIGKNTHAPKLALTNLLINNQQEYPGKGTLEQAITFTKHLRLHHNQNNFELEFAALHYDQPDKNSYRYQLKGHDKHLVDAGTTRSVKYNNLEAGDYTFYLTAANSDGVWSEKKALLTISILPPWYATWWATLIYVLLSVALLYAAYRFQLNRRLSQAEAHRLKELDAVKTKLYTNITHEFRTPLTVILGFAQSKERLGKEDDRIWGSIRRNAQRLLNLVNQMLELSKLESGSFSLNLIRSDLVAYLKYLAESFHSYAESKDIQLHFLSDEPELWMDYDPEKIQQITSNLLSNAIKFTDREGDIYVFLKKQDETLELRVRDTGTGITEEKLPHIFDRFYQGDETLSARGEGSGIGLSITRELVQMMDGTIEVKSQLGEGTEFIIHLPIRQEAKRMEMTETTELVEAIDGSSFVTAEDLAIPSAASGETRRVDERPLILIVEDNADVVQYLSTCLGPAYRLEVAEDGQVGIEQATELVPDVIISDVMMPHKDGFELCQTLKTDQRTSHIPIIMLTARADMESRLAGLEKGADAYLAKPFHRKELLVRIRKLLELRQRLRQHYLSVAGLQPSEQKIKELPALSHPEEDAFVSKVRAIVTDHLDDMDFNVQKLCREIGMSHSQLHRKLSALVGLSANKFIRYSRLQKARELLCNPNVSITEVAFDTGFSDPSYFGRVFKKEFGLTPMEYQEKKRLGA